MVKMTKKGKYHNSPPEKIIYYNTEHFFQFIADYIGKIMIVYAENIPPKFSLNKEGEFVVEYNNGDTYIYKEEKAEISEEKKDWE